MDALITQVETHISSTHKAIDELSRDLTNASRDRAPLLSTETYAILARLVAGTSVVVEKCNVGLQEDITGFFGDLVRSVDVVYPNGFSPNLHVVVDPAEDGSIDSEFVVFKIDDVAAAAVRLADVNIAVMMWAHREQRVMWLTSQIRVSESVLSRFKTQHALLRAASRNAH